ncbi:MAG: D-alanyl-D-alanine carboxypeptidase [Gaiellaceae bacterium]|nr:D-alanyl-D-alanine carboxypeptidase [Gaiellaceae bacterium]
MSQIDRPRPALQRIVEVGARGAAASVRDRVVVMSTAGDADVDEGFPIASVSKVFTAALTLRLVEQSVLSLDAALVDIFPEWQNLAAPRVTIRDALRHTTGIPSYDNEVVSTALESEATTLSAYEVCDLILQSATRPPQTPFSYSNTNYLLIGCLLERVTGQTLPSLLTNELFSPLELRRTELRAGTTVLSATGIGRPHGRWFITPWADGGLISTVADIGSFFWNLFRGAVLAPQTLLQMTTPINMRPRRHYGLGLARWQLPCGWTWGVAGDGRGGVIQVLCADDAARVVVMRAARAGRPDSASSPDVIAAVVLQQAVSVYCGLRGRMSD